MKRKARLKSWRTLWKQIDNTRVQILLNAVKTQEKKWIDNQAAQQAALMSRKGSVFARKMLSRTASMTSFEVSDEDDLMARYVVLIPPDVVESVLKEEMINRQRKHFAESKQYALDILENNPITFKPQSCWWKCSKGEMQTLIDTGAEKVIKMEEKWGISEKKLSSIFDIFNVFD